MELDTAHFQRKILLPNQPFWVPCFFVWGDVYLLHFVRFDFGSRLTSGRCAWVFPRWMVGAAVTGSWDPTPDPMVFEAAASLCSGAVAEVMVFCLESASSANALATHLAARCVAAGGPLGTLETGLKV